MNFAPDFAASSRRRWYSRFTNANAPVCCAEESRLSSAATAAFVLAITVQCDESWIPSRSAAAAIARVALSVPE
jgi:hypothetical protein